ISQVLYHLLTTGLEDNMVRMSAINAEVLHSLAWKRERLNLETAMSLTTFPNKNLRRPGFLCDLLFSTAISVAISNKSRYSALTNQSECLPPSFQYSLLRTAFLIYYNRFSNPTSSTACGEIVIDLVAQLLYDFVSFKRPAVMNILGLLRDLYR